MFHRRRLLRRGARAPLAAGILAALAVAAPAHAQTYRVGLPVPAYRLLSAMVAEVRDGTPLASTRRAAEVGAPLIRALDERYGAGVEKALRAALDAGDRDATYSATAALVLLDAQDLVESVRADDYTGWADAKVRLRKAFLDYDLVAAELHTRRAELDRAVVGNFGRLALLLRQADFSTPPEQVARSRDDLAAALARLRSSLVAAAPRAGPARSGG